MTATNESAPDLIANLAESLERRAPVHWVGDAPTSLHGNGAASFKRTTRSASEVTCRLCLTLLAREAGDSYLPEEAFAPEVNARMRDFLDPAHGNPVRALRFAVLELMAQESEQDHG